MSRVFHRKKFSDYLGEQRAIDDIYTFYEPDGGVTPTPTPIPVTPTPTPSITPTRTLTPTPTRTPTPTPTPGRFNFYGITGTSEFDVCISTSYGTIYQASQMPAIGQPLYYDSSLSNQITDIFWFISGGTRFYNSGFIPGPWSLQSYSPCPTPTPTPTVTTTNTATPTPTLTTTPTNTPTLTQTPTPSPGPAFDADAAAYLAAVVSAGGTVTSPMSAATNNMFLALKSNGIYAKLSAFYPILGGIQSSHAIEGKNPVGSQNLTFNGSWVHNDKGMRPSACSTSNYADTQYLPTSLNPNSNHMFAYFNGTGAQFGNACGPSTYDGAGPGPYFILGHPAFEFFSSDGVVSAGGFITAYGAVLGTRIASNDTKIFRSTDGGAWGQGSTTTTTAPSTYPSSSITIGKVNPTGFPSSERYAFFSFGDGLNTTEATNYYNIVLAYQTALNRNTY